MIQELTLLPGVNKNRAPETYAELIFKAGDTISIVGPTGSGKTALITDIELLAQGDTSTRRRVLINGQVPDDSLRFNPALKPIVMITQNTKCFADLTIEEFLALHARSRGLDPRAILKPVLELANLFTGEKIRKEHRVTTLSGGQTRSLLIADAILVGAAPVLLLDEIENAGIFRHEVLETIQGNGKVVVFVTHDPVIALSTAKRVVLENGGIKNVLTQSPAEKRVARHLLELDKRIGGIREELRAGRAITDESGAFYPVAGAPDYAIARA